MSTFYLDPENGTDIAKDSAAPKRLIFQTGSTVPVVDTTQVKYGTYALNMVSASANAGLETINDPNGGFAFGSGPFTIEAWVYHNTHNAAAFEVVLGNFASSNNLGWDLYWNSSGQLSFAYSTTGNDSPAVVAAHTPTTGAWKHVAVDCDAGGTIRTYYDGAKIASAARSAALFASTRDLFIGNDGNVTRKFPGYIGGVRITKGVARYATDTSFTPPTAAFPTNSTDDANWSSVTLCLNFNENGDGQSFANRWRTWLYGATAARIAPGDTIRVIASPAPSSVGNATWTNGSRTVTLASACTLTIDSGDTAWTGATNVTATATTVSGNRKQGTASAQFVVASAFTTGKVAYKATGTLDLSGYQQVSLWLRDNTANATGSLELRLCSDTTGDVTVHTIPLTDAVPVANGWRVVVKDFGVALSSSIASVSLWANSDPGAVNIWLDNILACKAASSADSLTHLSLIGKNTSGEPEWYPILSIDGTDVELGGANDAVLSTVLPRNYLGTSETVATVKVQPLDGVNGFNTVYPFDTTRRAFQDSGSDGSPITISGGWDRTAMSSQSGQTWLTGSHLANYALDLSGRSWVNLTNIGFAHLTVTPYSGNFNTSMCRWEQLGAVGCGYGAFLSNSWGTSFYLDVGNVVGCSTHGIVATTSSGNLIAKGRRITGLYGSISSRGIQFGADSNSPHQYAIDRIDNGAGYAISGNGNAGKAVFINLTMDNNASGDVNNVNVGDCLLINPTLSSGTPMTTSSGSQSDTVRIQKYNGGANDHRIYNRYYTIVTDSSTRHTASGISWKLSPLSTTVITSVNPAELPLMRRKLTANVAATLSCWLRRDNTGLTLGLKVRGGQLTGIASDVTATMTAAANTWEQISVTVTPTEDGVIELVGYAYGGSSFNGYFDDLSIS